MNVEIYNTPPVFVPDTAPLDMRARLNHTFEWYYPRMYDEQNNPIFVTIGSNPAMIGLFA